MNADRTAPSPEPSEASSFEDPQPLEFTISLAGAGQIVVREARGLYGGVFAGLSNAILFVREQGQARRCATIMTFDRTLGAIRAAG